MALASGGTLCLARQEVFVSGSDVLDYLRKQKISIVTMPPSVLNAMPSDDLPHLTTVVAAGESCPQQVVARWAPGRRFFNAYGPTETTVCASMALCDPNDARDPSIGWALPNFQLYILDRQMQLLPVGVPGELCVGGIGLARGYLNRPELTAEKFVPNPFSDDPTSRLYRTGDLVRCLPNGQIEFIGRIDNQVKVRGFRIELGEIESALAQHPALREVVIVAREDAGRDRRLVAYLISAVESAPSVSELRAFLRGRLPEYMVPSHFVFLETLPLTPNGKVDRRALPAPDGSRAQAEVEYVAPRTPAEITLAAIFAELLGVQQVGVYDNFFDLGGHSLLATQLVSRLRDAFDGEIPLRVIFENPTVAGLSEAIEMPSADLPQVNAPPIVPVSRDARRVRRSAIMSGGEQSYPGAEDVIAARTVE